MFLSSCSEENIITRTIEVDPGILRTDIYGNVLGGDTTDWCYEPCADSLFVCNKFLPAYPNPVIDTFYVRFDVQKNNSLIKLYFLNSQTDTNYLVNEYLQSGSYGIRLFKHSLNLTNVYNRIYLVINDFSCNGDLKF